MTMHSCDERDDDELTEFQHSGSDPNAEWEDSDDERQAEEHDKWEEIERLHELDELAGKERVNS